MISLTNKAHVKAFVNMLKAKYPLPARFTVNFLKSGHKTGNHRGNITLDKETKKAYCRIFEADKLKLYILLRVIAHEYKHALQYHIECKDTRTTESEIEACTFGFHESVKYCDRRTIPHARAAIHPGIGLKLLA